jgi:hypothetical protein
MGKTHAREVLMKAPSNVMEVLREMAKALTLCAARFSDPPSGSRSDSDRLAEWEEWMSDELRPAVEEALSSAREAGIEISPDDNDDMLRRIGTAGVEQLKTDLTNIGRSK